MLELDAYCRGRHLTGTESEHMLPFLPYRITISNGLGSELCEASGWTPGHAATAMLRRLDA